MSTEASLVAQLVKNPPAMWETWVWSLGWEDHLERGWLSTAIFWHREFHGLYSPWGCKQLDMTEWLTSLSCPLSWWCHPTIPSSAAVFSCSQSFPALGSFQMSQFLASGGQSIGDSALTSVLPVNILGWFRLGLTGWISLQSKGLSIVFSSTTIWRHQFFGPRPSLWPNSHIHTWLLEKTIALTMSTFVGKVMSPLFNNAA